MSDIYLAGYADTVWREEFKEKIANDIDVFDPFDENYDNLETHGKAELVAKELENMEKSSIIIFYICKEWVSLYGALQLGFATGLNKQIIVYLEEDAKSEEKIRRFCEYRGIVTVDTMDDLVENAEECVGQIELCKSIKF